MKLSPKKERFCQLVSEGVKLKEAYVQAGYAPKSSPQNSSKLHNIPEVRDRINELINVRHEELKSQYSLNRDKILIELGKIIYDGRTSNRDKISALQVTSRLMGLDVNLNANLNVDVSGKDLSSMSLEDLKTYLLNKRVRNDKKE